MDNDDRQIGRILSRREVLTLIGATGAALLVGCGATGTGATNQAATSGAGASPTLNAEAQTAAAIGSDPSAIATQQAEVTTAEAVNTQVATPNCVVRPEVTEGPYYVDVGLVRSDIREDRQGAPLELSFNVVQVADGACTPLEGATVEIWHCDAAGSYSGVSDPGFNTQDQKWLRGAQVTDANGVATFTTIYPGWYPGRGRPYPLQGVAERGQSVYLTALLRRRALAASIRAGAIRGQGLHTGQAQQRRQYLRGSAAADHHTVGQRLHGNLPDRDRSVNSRYRSE